MVYIDWIEYHSWYRCNFLCIGSMNESDGFITMFLSMFVVIIFSSWGHHVYVSEFVYQCTLSSFTELWLHFHLCTIVACQWSYRLLTLCTDTVLDIPLLSTYIFHWLLYDVSCDSALPESIGDFFFKTAMGLSFTYGLFYGVILLFFLGLHRSHILDR